ncbi:MAG: hypothetical protein OEW37_10650 [Rhodospirillaceae bacterium]|nr:hypothetical protein [Rhodospirillaceae bacterium]
MQKNAPQQMELLPAISTDDALIWAWQSAGAAFRRRWPMDKALRTPCIKATLETAARAIIKHRSRQPAPTMGTPAFLKTQAD